MKQATALPLFFVLYDGIGNSVFYGQVLQPLLQKLQKQQRTIYIVSFERDVVDATQIKVIESHSPHLKIIVLKKIPYVGLLSLLYAAYQLHNAIRTYKAYELMARGPLAGMICRLIYNQKKCKNLCIQARGLLAEEYAYQHDEIDQKNVFQKLIYALRKRQFASIEKKAYAHNAHQPHVKIEAVSRALQEYLITSFDADRNAIFIAQDDVPAHIASEQLHTWKQEVRTELGIHAHAKAYCYNGSLKPWQCPEKVITYFQQAYAHNPHAYLLVLTQDVHAFNALLAHSDIPQNKYHVQSVKHDEIYRYLAACDVGMLFREPHIVNWVSRPTKALEYQAVHLEVAHNNTVAWLMKTV